jgi:MFS family permease
MFILSLSHGALILYAGYSQLYAFFILFIIGCVSGGYMVVNLVLLIESLKDSRSRLLAVSLNGWPIGMSFVALVGYWTQNWRSYHIIMSITAVFLALILVRENLS